MNTILIPLISQLQKQQLFIIAFGAIVLTIVIVCTVFFIKTARDRKRYVENSLPSLFEDEDDTTNTIDVTDDEEAPSVFDVDIDDHDIISEFDDAAVSSILKASNSDSKKIVSPFNKK